jgi:hypothetical protein
MILGGRSGGASTICRHIAGSAASYFGWSGHCRGGSQRPEGRPTTGHRGHLWGRGDRQGEHVPGDRVGDEQQRAGISSSLIPREMGLITHGSYGNACRLRISSSLEPVCDPGIVNLEVRIARRPAKHLFITISVDLS